MAKRNNAETAKAPRTAKAASAPAPAASAPAPAASAPAPVDPIIGEMKAFQATAHPSYAALLERTRELHREATVAPLPDAAMTALFGAMLGAHGRCDTARGSTPKDGAVLELGPGASPQGRLRFLGLLNSESYTAVDVNPAEGVCSGLVESLPEWRGIFQWVLAVRVLEHSFDPDGVLGEVERVLKPGGFFGCAISTTNDACSLPRTVVLGPGEWLERFRRAGLRPLYIVELQQFAQIHIVAAHPETARLVGLQ